MENSGNSNHKPRMQRKSEEEDREIVGMAKTKTELLGWFAILFFWNQIWSLSFKTRG